MSENNSSAPQAGKKLYIVLGIVFSVLAMFFILTVSLESVLFSPSFYIKLEDDYQMSERMGLSKDGYIRYYNCFMTYIAEGDESALKASSGITDPFPLFSSSDKQSLAQFRGIYASMNIAKWIAIALCAAIIILVFVRATKAEVRIIGKTGGIAVPLLAAVLFTVYLFIRKSLPPLIPDIAQTGLLKIFMEEKILSDLYKGWITMCLIFSLIPLAVSLFFAKVGKRRHEDITDDYMYQ